EKRKAEEAKKKAEAEKARKLLEGEDDKQWMVQVALAANEANADAIAAKLRAKGYKVTKSPTSKGIRIMVGPSKDREAADAIRKKIASDASLNMKSAWVNDWVPLDKR
ncbi:SPOR domain-containing protein, partial [Escherichia coli]